MATLSPNSAKTKPLSSTTVSTPSNIKVETRIEGIDGHYNRITKQWEEPGTDQYLVSSVQDGSTCPEEVGGNKISFKNKLFGRFGKSNKDVLPHSRNQSESLLNDQSNNNNNSTPLENLKK